MDVWLVDLAVSADGLDRCAPVLDRSERERGDRFLRPVDRARYIASHAALRLVLAEACACAPSEIRLTANATGKPELARAFGSPAAFNLSHSGARALIGLAGPTAIGVDIELIRPIPDAVRIARTHFAPDEAAALASLPPDAIEAAFFGLWTRKEAVVKAQGTGLSLPLDRFSVTVPPAAPRLLRDSAGWTLAAVEAGAGYAATVAVRADDTTIRHHTLSPDWPDRLGLKRRDRACSPAKARL
ncbi:4'-phosphopantetheinyl transferase superfamily protein [Methylobacterium sp. J-030]|uniref:4'-phosphopantetheinyl transferase family protein n=1 Tax=Methylobacterium sp. J-030 TaxID=2836627 RepID=UPI001FBA75CD|nr:4'-phosphopantetheinyl transferase superfamily protein [Methylobacterium sp. J-030]MCJ2070374.1 4'-phosphopantetheinyl transferase superfamily protein [Methylobacterium sp. J-030]